MLCNINHTSYYFCKVRVIIYNYGTGIILNFKIMGSSIILFLYIIVNITGLLNNITGEHKILN